MGTPERWVLITTLEAYIDVVHAGITTNKDSILGNVLFLEE
jgi:hypothetical protein